jgi:phosphatidylglycerophosphatase A
MKRSAAVIIGSLGGIGYLPRGAATVGTFLGAAIFAAMRPSPKTRLAMVVGATLAGQFASSVLATDEDSDPSFVIVDELAGVWLALSPLPVAPARLAAGAAAFRLLDRTKPSVVGLVDERGGRYSVMGDDLAAGLITALILVVGASLAGSAA